MAFSLSELRQLHCIVRLAVSPGKSVLEHFVKSDVPRGTAQQPADWPKAQHRVVALRPWHVAGEAWHMLD